MSAYSPARATTALSLAAAVLSASCSAVAPVDRTFCVKVYYVADGPPASCNSRPASDSQDPTITVHIQRGLSYSIVLETQLLTGPSGGKANLTVPSQFPAGISATAAGNDFRIPGSTSVRFTSTTPFVTLPLKLWIEDDDTGIEHEVVVLMQMY